MIRATVFENGDSTNGKVMSVPATTEKFLEKVREIFGNPEYNKIYSVKGGHIIDISLIRYVYRLIEVLY